MVDCAGDQFLSGAAFAHNENARLCCGDHFNLLQNALQSRTAAQYLAERAAGFDFFTKVVPLLLQAMTERFVFLKGAGVRNGNRSRTCHRL